MLDKMIHVNNRGDILDFLKLGIFINSNELRNYEWLATKTSDTISTFTKGVTNRVIPFVFFCDSDMANQIKDTFYEHFEVDILDMEPGYFEINGYRYYCYLTKSKKSDYLLSKKRLTLKVEIMTDQPYWIKENRMSFSVDSVQPVFDSKMFPYHYSYIYGKTPGNESITNDSMKPSHFRFVIYGPISNPSISISGHTYNVNCEVSNSEYLVIDSRTREIYIMTISGEKENVFNKRNFESYIFEKIPVGYSLVAWSGGFGFDLIIYDERSEPKWT